MDQLWALPIRGEAFLLRRSRYLALIDGGWDGEVLALAVTSQEPAAQHIDVVVCTHADQDHAGGLANFLDHWRIAGPGGAVVARTIGQLWLPGCWVNVLSELLRDPVSFVNGLIANLDGFAADHPGIAHHEGEVNDLTQILDPIVRAERQVGPPPEPDPEAVDAEPIGPFDQFFDEDEVDLGAMGPFQEPAWFQDLRGAVAELIENRPTASRAFHLGRRRIRHRQRRGRIGGGLRGILVGTNTDGFEH